MPCLTTWGQWAVELLQCTALLPGGSGQCNSRNALPHCMGAVGGGTPAMHCLTAWGQWVVELLQCIAPLPRGSGRWNSCNALPHRLGAVASGTPGGVWCGVAWCVVRCGVVWCGVVCRRRYYQMAKGRDVYPRAKVNGLGCVCCVRAVCRHVVLGRRSGEAGITWRAPPWRPSLFQELPLHPLSFRLLVQAQLVQRPRHGAALAQVGL